MFSRPSLVAVSVLIAFIATAWRATPVHAQAVASTSVQGIVARADDIAISADELDRWWQANDPVGFAQIRRGLFEGRKRAIDALLAERLLQAEAIQRQITVDQLLAVEAAKRVTAPTDEAILEMFAQSRSPAISFEDARPIITDYLVKQSAERARETYVRELRDRHAGHMTIALADPAREVKAATVERSIGAANAPVEVVEFADFQCPFCGALEPVMKRVVAAFGNRIRFVWKDFPLSSIHEHAEAAAVAARCAGEQGAFWSFHDLLFNHQAALALQNLREYARDLSLDVGRFNQCLTAPDAMAGVQADAEEGTLRGVQGTPTVFINGEPLSGALDYDDYEQVIARELARGQNSR